MSPKGQCFYRFGPFQLDPSDRVLWKGDRPVSLTPKALHILILLVENRGHVVEKEELLSRVWPDTFVEEGTLTQNVFTLRRQLGSDGTYIETIPRRGYRFAATVETTEGEPAGAAEEQAGIAVNQPEPAVESKAAFSAVPGPELWRRFANWRVVASAALVLFLLVAAAMWRGYLPLGARRRIMLVVLPVENLTGDPGQEYLSDGLTEELTAQLGRLNPARLGVIARTSSMAYKGTQKSIREIGLALGVDYVIESSVRMSGGRLRVTAQLISVRDQSHVWAESYERDLNDILRVESEISAEVVRSIRMQLAEPARIRLASAASVSPEVYSTYLKGRFYWNTRTRDGLLKSIDYYNQVLQLDPINARAYAGLADSYNLLGYYGFVDAREVEDKARAAAEKALQLDPKSAEAQAALAYGNFYWFWKWPEAEQGFRRALDLNDNYLPAHQWYALYLGAMGRPQESLDQVAAAKRLDPLSPVVFTAAGWLNYFARRYDDAIAESQAALALNANLAQGHFTAGLAYEAKGDLSRAISEFQTAAHSVRAPWYVAALAHAYAVGGRTAEAQNILDELQERKKNEFVGSSNLAVVYDALGNHDRARVAVQEAAKESDPGLIWLKVDPRLSHLRSDPWVRSWVDRVFGAETRSGMAAIRPGGVYAHETGGGEPALSVRKHGPGVPGWRSGSLVPKS